MKPFKFSLRALYIVRERNEQEKLEKYSDAVKIYQKCAELLKYAENELDDCWEQIRKFHKNGGKSNELTILELTKKKAEEECRLRFDELMLAQQNMEKALREWFEAKKEKDAVEKFRVRQKARYDMECRREEQKLLDEMKSRMGSLSELIYK